MTAVLAAPPATDKWVAWDRFLERTPDTGFMQSSWWAEFRATTGYRHFGALVRDGDAVVGGAVVMRLSYADGRCFYYIPEGPVLPEDESVAADVLDSVLATIEDRRRADSRTVSHLRIEPRWLQAPGFLRGFRALPAFQDVYTEPRTTLCIDLRPSEDAILAQMKPKGRYNIRLAQRHGVTVVEDTSECGLADFLRIYTEMTERQRIGRKPDAYFLTLLSGTAPRGRSALFFAEHQGRRVAAALVLSFGARATYFYGGSLDSHRHVMAPYLLHFEIMRRARLHGHEWYDFWGIAPSNDLDHPWQDISGFKRKFGGHEVTLVPTMDLVYDEDAYVRYREWAR